MFVATFQLNGGLYQVMLRLRLRELVLFWLVGGWNFNWCWYPLFDMASWYNGAALWNESSSDDISQSRLFIASGMFCSILGGWFDLLWT